MKLSSDNKFLQSAFEWAADKTKEFVVTGKKAGDSIGAMYQAVISYAKILELRGNDKEAKLQFNRAEKLSSFTKGYKLY